MPRLTIVALGAIAVAPLLRAFGLATPRNAAIGAGIVIALLSALLLRNGVDVRPRELAKAFGLAFALAIVTAIAIVFAWCGGVFVALVTSWPALVVVYSIWPYGYDQAGAGILGPVVALVADLGVWTAIFSDVISTHRRRRLPVP